MEIKTNGRAAQSRIRLKRVIIAGAVASSIIVSGAWMGFNAMADLLNPAREDTKITESLDTIGGLHSKAGSGFEVNTHWDDEKIQHTIHAMTHQKVEADRKWSSVEMTEERIVTLSNIVEENAGHLAEYDTYREILDKWMEGDFSEVDTDHNAIWYLQGGTIGKATGIMSESEEKEFIESVFE